MKISTILLALLICFSCQVAGQGDFQKVKLRHKKTKNLVSLFLNNDLEILYVEDDQRLKQISGKLVNADQKHLYIQSASRLDTCVISSIYELKVNGGEKKSNSYRWLWWFVAVLSLIAGLLLLILALVQAFFSSLLYVFGEEDKTAQKTAIAGLILLVLSIVAFVLSGPQSSGNSKLDLKKLSNYEVIDVIYAKQEVKGKERP
jgi:hypothetical protein